jgi:mono/diheme cytochrome c family protein
MIFGSRSVATLVALLALALPAAAQNDSGPDAGKPVVMWQFDGKAEPGVGKLPALKEPGPRPPTYPGFAATNASRAFEGKGLTIREADLPGVDLRFKNGDAITLEAWVRVKEISNGQYAYILGKGRTHKPGFPEKNQNYALRLFGSGGGTKVSFLFSSGSAGQASSLSWHRWTSTSGFSSGGWHHVAVSYTFGKPESIRGYIDGKKTGGTWDMGGATTRPPVADGDDLQLGTGNGGGAGNSLRGWLDEVAIWRKAIAEDELVSRFQFVPPPPVVKREDLPKGQVLVQLCEEGMPAHNAWPDLPLPPTETYREEAFGFFEVPHKYVDTGVRGDRANPYLFRAAAVVKLPAGKNRILLRGRGAARLYIDGKLLLSTPFPPTDSSGHGTVASQKWLDLGPDFRFNPPGNREAWTTLESDGREHLVILETIVGNYIGKSSKRRPELGETVAAISPEGSQSWQLLSPGSSLVPYTDTGWAAYEAEREAHLDRVNAAARAAKRAEHADYWAKRRETAKQWLSNTKDEAVPRLPKGYPANNAIDHFLAVTIERAVAYKVQAAKGTVDYFRDVQPLLEAKCYSCHTGTGAKGKLRLDDRAAALAGGRSDGPAVTPGKPGDSALLLRVKATDADVVMPPKGDRLTRDEIKLLETWMKEGARWPDLNAEHTTLTPLCDDLAFLRRVYIDTVGVVPTLEENRAFEADRSPDRRAKLIDRLLADPRWADNWMGYWQDVLAENPNIINPTLNNTGPFRWWIYESLRDNKPLDLFVTELLRMRGSVRFGGPAGFGVAAQNDSPFAAKGTVVAAAFLGVEMKCARCHDAPAHPWKQQELFEIAAMLGTKPLTVPATSSVPLDKIHSGGRKPLIQVTLKPGTTVEPVWPFAQFVKEELGAKIAEYPDDPRDRLAALITAPQNERFAQVTANRIWRRFMGRGIVEPVEDWEKGKPSHPGLLRWLGRELVRSGYDAKHLARLILNSHAYQRATDKSLEETGVLFASPAARRLEAEQIVDALYAATGKPFKVEEVSLDIDGIREMNTSITLGQPRRAWMLSSISNERDRPSLSLPRIRIVSDVLQAYGWRGARQDPASARDHEPNTLQPAILANGVMGQWLTRLSDDHGITKLAIDAKGVDELIDAVFLRILTRHPTEEERERFRAYISDGFADRVLPPSPAVPLKRKPVPYVSWSNHLDPEANVVRLEQEAAARAGATPTDRLDPAWRKRMEDVLWSLVNSPEFVFTP